jgi:hypothetical protein
MSMETVIRLPDSGWGAVFWGWWITDGDVIFRRELKRRGYSVKAEDLHMDPERRIIVYKGNPKAAARQERIAVIQGCAYADAVVRIERETKALDEELNDG